MVQTNLEKRAAKISPIIQECVSKLGTSAERLKLFIEIYRGASRSKSVKALASSLGWSLEKVLNLGLPMVRSGLVAEVEESKGQGKCYARIQTIIPVKSQVIQYSQDREMRTAIIAFKKVNGQSVVSYSSRSNMSIHNSQIGAVGDSNTVSGNTFNLQNNLTLSTLKEIESELVGFHAKVASMDDSAKQGRAMSAIENAQEAVMEADTPGIIKTLKKVFPAMRDIGIELAGTTLAKVIEQQIT